MSCASHSEIMATPLERAVLTGSLSLSRALSLAATPLEENTFIARLNELEILAHNLNHTPASSEMSSSPLLPEAMTVARGPLAVADEVLAKIKAVPIDKKDFVVMGAIEVHDLLCAFKCKVLIPLLPATQTVVNDVTRALENLEQKIANMYALFVENDQKAHTMRAVMDHRFEDVNWWQGKILVRHAKEAVAMFETQWIVELRKVVKELQ